jgi:hypothetical protein
VDTTILIAPGEGPLALALAAEARQAGWKCALAVKAGDPAPAAQALSSPGSGAASRAEPVSDKLSFSWNPASYVSASALAIAATAAIGEIEVLALVADPATALPDLLLATPGAAAAGIESACLGPALLAREMLRRFAARGRGRILLLCAEQPADAPAGPAAALAAGAFRGLGDGIFATGGHAAWGVIDASGQVELAARFALRLLDEKKAGKTGRWLRFTGKPGIFGIF